MRLEKRDVYIKEFWSMSFKDRYIYSIVNAYYYSNHEDLVFNPLKWSVCSVTFAFFYLLFSVLQPVISLAHAVSLKNKKMPVSNDPMFKGGTDWRVCDRWVVEK